MDIFVIKGESGSVRATYNLLGQLNTVEFSEEMPDTGRAFILRELPILINQIEVFTNKFTKLKVIQEVKEITFEDFWERYNNKVGKQKAILVWDKLNRENQRLAFFAIFPYNRFLQLNQWRSKQDPATYLRQKTFLDYGKK